MQQPSNPVIREGSYLVDVETGEIVGTTDREAAWQPTTHTDVEWVVELMHIETSAIKALDVRKQTIINNLESMRKEHDRKLIWLYSRFNGALEQFARTQLEGSKRRSVKTPFGTLQLRWGRGRKEILNHTDAAARLEEHDFDQGVHWTARVNVTELDEPALELLRKEGLLKEEPPVESFTVDL